jgi:hypothetical protein
MPPELPSELLATIFIQITALMLVLMVSIGDGFPGMGKPLIMCVICLALQFATLFASNKVLICEIGLIHCP